MVTKKSKNEIKLSLKSITQAQELLKTSNLENNFFAEKIKLKSY